MALRNGRVLHLHTPTLTNELVEVRDKPIFVDEVYISKILKLAVTDGMTRFVLVNVFF